MSSKREPLYTVREFSKLCEVQESTLRQRLAVHPIVESAELSKHFKNFDHSKSRMPKKARYGLSTWQRWYSKHKNLWHTGKDAGRQKGSSSS